jgi:hypothetical protein
MNRRTFKVRFCVLMLLSTAALTRAAQTPISTNLPPTPAALASLERNGKREADVHDPSTIVKCKDEYWLFATGVGVNSWRSRDLLQWERGPRARGTRAFSRKPECFGSVATFTMARNGAHRNLRFGRCAGVPAVGRSWTR